MTKSLFPIVVVTLLLLSACADEQATVEDIDTTAAADPAMADTAAQTGMQEKINLNTASEDEFRTIPGVGDQMIGEFIEYRPYVSIREFREEIGKYVDEEQVATYEEYVFVPVNPNESDEATLQQLPGVNASVASELLAGRPYESNQAFLEALGTHVAPEQVSLAERYLAEE